MSLLGSNKDARDAVNTKRENTDGALEVRSHEHKSGLDSTLLLVLFFHSEGFPLVIYTTLASMAQAQFSKRHPFLSASVSFARLISSGAKSLVRTPLGGVLWKCWETFGKGAWKCVETLRNFSLLLGLTNYFGFIAV